MAKPGHIALGCLLGHILQLIPGGGSFTARVGQHILVVEQGQAVAAKGKAVKLVVQLAGVQRALIILVDPIPIADLVADIREDSHGRVRGVVRAVDDYQVGKLRRAGSDGQLLFKVGKGDIFCRYRHRILGVVVFSNDPVQGFLVLFGLPIVPNVYL